MILAQDPRTGYWIRSRRTGVDLRNVHDPSSCEGRGCAIHDHPSDHPLKDAPLNWRTDAGKLERMCEHGIGHDDYDAVQYQKSITPESEWKWLGVHGCCGICCRFDNDSHLQDNGGITPDFTENAT